MGQDAPEVFFSAVVGWLSLGQIEKTPVFFVEIFERKRKTWNPTKVVEVWVQRFFFGVLELRTPEIFCLY